MPYLKTRLSAAALLLMTGCATPNFFTGSASKANSDLVAASGPPASKSSSSWSGPQNANAVPQDAGAAAALAGSDSEHRIQDLLAAAERSQNAGDRRAARSALEQVLRLAPGDASANYQLAIMDDEEKRYADAERHYFVVLKQSPNNPDILSSLGWSYFLAGRYDDSNKTLRDALRYDPNHKFALNNLGMLYGSQGDYDGALQIFRLAGSEADAQRALALLKESASAVPVANEQIAASPSSGADQPLGSTTVTSADSRAGTAAAGPEFGTPQGRKFAADFKRLKAENDKKQQEKRARIAQKKKLSAPSPWNNDRNAAPNGTQALAAGITGRDGSVDTAQFSGSPQVSDAAFPGAAPSQANRPRTADAADFGSAGNAGGSVGNAAGVTSGLGQIPATQAIFEQPQGQQGQVLQGQGPAGQLGAPAGEPTAPREINAGSWNSLPPDDSNRGNPSGTGPAPANRLPEWPRSNPGNPGVADQIMRTGMGGAAAGQSNSPPPPRGYNSRQEAQAAAAQMGLSAGSGGLGFPAADWPGSTNGQNSGIGNGLNPSSGQGPAATQNAPAQIPSGQFPNMQPAGQQPTAGGQFQQGQGPASAAPNGAASSLPPWPGRPLSGGLVPQSVVPSAQGVVYGSTGDSGMPSMYPVRTAAPPAR